MDTYPRHYGRARANTTFADVPEPEQLRSLLHLSYRLMDAQSADSVMVTLSMYLEDELNVSEALFLHPGPPELSFALSGRRLPAPADEKHALMASARASLRGVVVRRSGSVGVVKLEIGVSSVVLVVNWARHRAPHLIGARENVLVHAAELAGKALHVLRGKELDRACSERNHAAELARRDQLEEQMRVESMTDSMTGLTNRRGFFISAEHAFRLARRKGICSAVIFADVDHLKTINDQLGHHVGDALICDAANIFRQSFRDADIVARLGGDEFVAFTLDDERPQAVLARVATNIEAFNAAEPRPYTLSFSTGVVACDPLSKCSLADYLLKADQEMYDRKQTRMH
jgi:diguanylate cyclase (GGDEF)-like protein